MPLVTADKELVTGRGHRIEGVKNIPLIVDDHFQGLRKTSEVGNALRALGLEDEMIRCSENKTRAGRGKSRGRRTIKRKGPLIIVAEDKEIMNAAKNIPGIDMASPGDLSVSMLAPGTVPGRLSIWTRSAIGQVAEALK